MDILPALLIFGLIGLFGAVIYFVVRVQRKIEAEKTEAAQAAGFSPLTAPDPIHRRIVSLHEGPGRRQLKASHLYSKRFPDGQMILYDLKETSGESDTDIAEQEILFISSYLQMPRFTLQPRPPILEGEGGLGVRLMNWAVSLGAGQHMEDLGHAAFDARYWVSAPDEAAARAFLTPDRLEQLARTQPVRLEACEDMFSALVAPYARYQADGQKTERLTISQKVQQAMQFFQILSGPATGPVSPFVANPLGAEAAPTSLPAAHAPAGAVCPQCGAPRPSISAAGEQTCPYCGAAVYAVVSGPLVPKGADVDQVWQKLEDESWQRQVLSSPTIQKVRKVEAVGCTLPFAVVWTLFACFFLVMLSGMYMRDLRTYQLLLNDGVSANAVVTGLVADDDGEDVTYQVYYTYQAGTQSLIGKENVSKAVYGGLREGQSVRIRYASSQPQTSGLAETFAPPSLLMPLFGGCMALGFVAIGIGLIFQTVKTLKYKN